MERRLLREYTALLNTLVETLTHENYHTAQQLAELPDNIRGFGHVKQQSVVHYDTDRESIIQQYNNPGSATATAA